MNLKLDFWITFGLLSQFFFFLRFLIQWYVSEKKKASVIPDVFWYLSVLGATGLLIYSVHRQDLVFILGNSVGVLIYLRNIYFIRRQKCHIA